MRFVFDDVSFEGCRKLDCLPGYIVFFTFVDCIYLVSNDLC